jgi:hypothetical protein
MATHATTSVAPLRNLTSKPALQRGPYRVGRSHSFVIWIALIGIVLPPIPIPLGELTFTPARMIVILLLAPALATLLSGHRRPVASDFFAVAAAAWMLGSSALSGGFRLYVGAEVLDFLGAYIIGRAFFLGPANLQTFSRAFKFVVIVVIAFGALDAVSGRQITLEIFGIGPQSLNFQPMETLQLDTRNRATSVFPTSILFGTFCAAAAAIFLYSERTIFSRIFFVSLSLFGCALSQSSGPLLASLIVAASYCYDRILKQYPWRWKLLALIVAGATAVTFLVSNSPVAWIITHLTLNPATGFWRYTIWDISMNLISASPWIGYGLIEFKGEGWTWWMLSLGVDCVWLVEAIRYGLPCVLLLGLTIFAPFFRRNINQSKNLGEIRTGFGLAVTTLALIGLTVHFWDSAWLFFFVCVGIRATFAERATGRYLDRPIAAPARTSRSVKIALAPRRGDRGSLA